MLDEQYEQIMKAIENVHCRIEALDKKVNDINAAVNSYPAALKLYKGVSGNNGALQIDLTPLHKSRRDIGAVFLSAAPTIGNNIYDWEQKINMALNLSDIATILNTFRSPNNEILLWHDKFKGTNRENEIVTKLTIKRSENQGWRWGLGRRINGKWRYINIPVTDGETVEIRILLERAVARILAW